MNADYNALQVTAEKRMGKHFGLKGFYTFSKAIDDAQLQNNTTQGSVEDFHNMALDRGLTDYNRKHSLVSSVIWTSNYFDNRSALVRNVFNGWQVSAVVTLQSGTPFTVTTGQDTNLDGNNNDRANLIANPVLSPNRSRAAVTAAWFTTSAFVAPAAGQDGNAARNVLIGPGNKNVDLGLFRTFKLKERLQLQARSEVTNGFNLVNLGGPTASLSSSLFGQIRTAGTMRQVQVGLRLTF
jgi:hypothetical protein